MSAQGIVQYVIVRSDLCKTLGWPVGALLAQGNIDLSFPHY